MGVGVGVGAGWQADSSRPTSTVRINQRDLALLIYIFFLLPKTRNRVFPKNPVSGF
jgi:hypothetical protein